MVGGVGVTGEEEEGGWTWMGGKEWGGGGGIRVGVVKCVRHTAGQLTEPD